ncbi:MAG: hypothetical protein WCV84_00260 [Patescibacteria group bacterium]
MTKTSMKRLSIPKSARRRLIKALEQKLQGAKNTLRNLSMTLR